MDKRTIAAIFLSFLIFLGWQKFYLEPRTRQTRATQIPAEQPQATVKTKLEASSLKKPEQPLEQIKTQREEISLKGANLKMVNQGGLLEEWDLEQFHMGLSQVAHLPNPLEIRIDHPDYAYLSHVRGEFKKEGDQILWSYEDEKILLQKKVTFNSENTYYNLSVMAQFKKEGVAKNLILSLKGATFPNDLEEMDRKIAWYAQKSFNEQTFSGEIDSQDIAEPIVWAGILSRYFIFAVVPESNAVLAKTASTGEKQGEIQLYYPVQKNEVKLDAKIFYGAKELEALRAIHPSMDHAVDLGWFTIVAYPILSLMKVLYKFLNNYGLAIIVLTLLIKIATYPLTFKSMKSMKEMAKVQPQIQKLKDKYGDNREALNREMLALMKNTGYNPMAGCLPIIIQMPVFFALYRVLYSAVELYQAPFYFWIHDLSTKDPYYVTPILLMVTMLIQQRLTPNMATDPLQRKMMNFMPILFGALMMNLPSGLTLYMLVNTVATIVQQMILNKKLGVSSVPAVSL